MNANVPSLARRIADLIAEYDAKAEGAATAAKAFEDAKAAVERAGCIGNSYAGSVLSGTAYAYEARLKDVLLKSAWKAAYAYLQIDVIAPADDKRRFERAIEQPAPFTLDNIRATFGDYVSRPRHHILRGLAEVFCQLDPAYKSHSKVRIGVKGLPKRVILTSFGLYGSYGRDRLRDIINALAAYQGKPLFDHQEMLDIEAQLKTGDADICGPRTIKNYKGEEVLLPGRGMTIRRFHNGNGHVFFDAVTLVDINRALAEFYGDVLPDVEEQNPVKRASTEVAKDLQYYPTPHKVVQEVLSGIYIREGQRVLEPSCGCGRIMDGLKHMNVRVLGFEIDPGRAAQARAKGHAVVIGNFLEQAPGPEFDLVVMNPPFYGRHYLKHVRHALKFLKPSGVLVSILPASAWYDHKELDGAWTDLPPGSFGESGTNVPTGYLRIRADAASIARAA